MKNSLFILRKNSSNFIKNFNIPKVREYTLKNFKSDCKTLIAKANLLIDNTFVFKEKWDMEQCHTPYKLKNINWIQSPNGDEEWIFMLNRQDYLYNLIIAFYLTNEYKYLDKWKYLVLDWIDKNKINPSNPLPGCRTIDTGIRCLNWTLSLALIAHNNYFTDAELTKIIHSIDSQNNFLKEKFIDKHRIVNWGVLQTTGMLSSLILTKETPYENEIFKWALNKYNEQLTLQIFDDGIQWEQSPMYHVEVLLSTLKLLHLCREFNISLTNNIQKTTLKMSKTLLYTTKPNFHQVMQSDSDDTDTRDILVKSAMLFNDSELKFRGYEKADFESAWLFGYNFINSYNKIIAKKPSMKNKYFKDAGNLYLRTDWNRNATFSYFHNGSIGGGHGHADLLHYDITYKGKNFLIDTGRYTYLEKNKYRNYFKSAYAHNTIVVDNDPFTTIKDSWCFNKVAEPFKNYVNFKDDINYIEMMFNGILDNKNSYIIIRKVINIEPSIWIIIDHIKSSGPHTINKFYHLDTDVTVSFKINYSLLEKDNENLSINHFGIDDIKIKNDYISKHFNNLENSKTIVSQKSFIDIGTCYDVIYGKELRDDIQITPAKLYQAGKVNPLSDNDATAIEIKINNKTYLISVTHREIFSGNKLLLFNNTIPLYGKTIVIESILNHMNYIKLKY